mmetsp:Transcript_14026/g.35838  ORF Transcript_14026/g.35838 Transcript_14026/m.35838 type:complete len:203 (-) Transcript_14026:98-706(-)|eukprot:CAMPEP_0177636886 /NCGR_PEP_ID=MMETSP0447-20121125/4677_1 /TAXON_ID=0 /ORGANISM="Stygamoeba regulata, Strain BSH-02190019" /LENGTH=202 /DNA_ID=CAMNT_0019138777 /DNA_START=126 /DNA_END=734 /DNA_ORIENTATION=+
MSDSPKKQSLSERMKKNVSSKVAGSTLGGKVLNSALPPEIQELVKSLRRIVKGVINEKTADSVEKGLFRIILKLRIQVVDAKNIKAEDLLEADKPLRAALNGLDRVFRNWNPSKKEAIQKVLAEVETNIAEAVAILKKHLKGHMKEKNLKKVDEVVSTIGSASFHMKMFETCCAQEESTPLYQDLFNLIHAMNQYTAFHYDV